MSPAEFIRQVKSEARRVSWLGKKEISSTTLMVIVFVIIASIFFIIVDWISYQGIKLIFNLGGV